jgi:hypothetical protein
MRDAKPVDAQGDRSVDAVEGDRWICVRAIRLQQARREGADRAEEEDDQEGKADEPTVGHDLAPGCVVEGAHDDSLSVRTALWRRSRRS